MNNAKGNRKRESWEFVVPVLVESDERKVKRERFGSFVK
jgi:hypothetical protein